MFLVVSCSGWKDKNSVNEQTTSKDDLPNIIYVLTDDLGYGDVSSFNPKGKIFTPNIDRLAQEGMKFTDAHTSSAVCTPTRYGILTGRYNWRSPLKSGVLTGTSPALIPNERETAASLLKRSGYHTAYIGKWHLGWNWAKKEDTTKHGIGWDAKDFENIDFAQPITHAPNDLGFDYAYGHAGSLDMAPYVYVENRKVTDLPDRQTVNKDSYGFWREGPTGSDFVHEEVTPHFFEKSFSYIQEQAKTKQPFFLYLPLPSPHTPILPADEWKGKSGINVYADFVMMVDNYMGQLGEVLKEAGIEKNTILIFTSDNGCSPMANFEVLKKFNHNPSGIYRGHKADIFEGGHRVPFIVRWPKEIQPGTISNATICTTDFIATCAEIVGEKLADNAGEDSFSMLPLFMDPNTGNYERSSTVHHSINGSFAIRKDEWKLIFCPDSGGWSAPKPNSEEAKKLPKYQLYNLAKDPSETINLVDEEPEIVEELTALMSSTIEHGRSTKGSIQKNDAPLDGGNWPQIEQFELD